MILSYRIGMYTLILSAAFASSFFYGQGISRKAALQGAVSAYRKRERINGDVSRLRDIDLCIALGGMSDECATLMRELNETTESEQPGQDGQR